MHEHDDRIRELFAQGLPAREIGAQLGLSESQVWSRHRKLALPHRRGHYTHGVSGQDLRLLEAQAKLYGRIDYDDAPLPNGNLGFIAFIGDTPGCACVTQKAALRSAIAARSGA